MEKTYIFGHHNPDTDSVCSAIALSYYKNKLGFNTEPRILDEINKETEFVLKKFKVSEPSYLDNVKLQIKDIEYHKNYCMKNTVSIKKVYDFLLEKSITGLPIVDDDDNFVGLITLKMILNKLIGGNLRRISTSYDNILEVLNAKEVLRFNEKIEGEVLVGGYRSMIFVNEIKLSDKDILVTSNRPMIINYAINEGIKNIVVVGTQDLDQECYENAKKNKVNVFRTKYDSFYTLKLISLSNYAEFFCDSDRVTCFYEDDYYNDFVDISKKLKYNNYPVITDNNKCLGLLRLTDLDNVNRKKVILVDHNESGQSVMGLGQSEIVEIVDHHKIGDLTTNNPINFRNMAVGSTNTIVYQLYKEKNMEIPKDIAGLMLSGILSDTLILNSPTTTLYDKEAVVELSKIADIDYEKYGIEMFKAGTSLKGKTKEEIINTDKKSFNYDEESRYAVSQIFTLDIDSIMEDKDSYIKLIEEMKEQGNYKFIVVAVTDILKNGSYFIFTESAKEILEAGYAIQNIKQGEYIDGQVSRKKQIVPALINGINRLK